MLDSMHRIAVWNLVTAVDAFLSAGFTPAELLRAVHPSDVACTQGTGIGGMESLRKVFLDRFLGEDRPQDILQEALPNVVAAHVMQAYVGGYGAMIHPVAACATAAVSVEEAVDKITVGKAMFVVAGGIDDIGVESLTGFGDMNATADSAVMAAKESVNASTRGQMIDVEVASSKLLVVELYCWHAVMLLQNLVCQFSPSWHTPSRMLMVLIRLFPPQVSAPWVQPGAVGNR